MLGRPRLFVAVLSFASEPFQRDRSKELFASEPLPVFQITHKEVSDVFQ